MVGCWGYDIMEVKADGTISKARHDSRMVNEAEVLTDLGVSGIVPVAEGFCWKILQQELHFRFVGHGIVAREVLEAQGKTEFLKMGEENVERITKGIEIGLGVPIAFRHDLGELLLVARGAEKTIVCEVGEFADVAIDGDTSGVEHDGFGANGSGEIGGCLHGIDAVFSFFEVVGVAEGIQFGA